MALLLLEDVRRLLGSHQAPCISIMFPTVKAGADTRQNLIRFKNLVRKASDSLEQSGAPQADIKRLLAPAQSLLHDDSFWQDQGDSFAMFLSDDTNEHYTIPFRLEESVKVNNRFHTSPLLPMFFENGRFYMLALSQSKIRLFQVAFDNIRQVTLTDIPQNIDEMLADYTGEKHIEWHTQMPVNTSSTKRGMRQAYFHGQGSASLHSEDKIQQFFYMINKGVHNALLDEHVPLVFVGVDYLFPMWKAVNTYSNLCSKSIETNPDRLSPKELLDRARLIVAPRFTQAKLDAIDKYKQFVGSGHTTSDPAAIAQYARQGRIDILFLATNTQIPVVPNKTAGTIQAKNELAIGDDIINEAASETFLNRGRVFRLHKTEMPDKTDLCATLRY